MTNRLELNWKLDGFVDEQRYYCSESPFTAETKPTPKVILAGDVRTYTDQAIEINKTYYVAVVSVKNGVEKLSEVRLVRANGGDEHWDKVVSLLHFDGNLTDEKGSVWTGLGIIVPDGRFGAGVNTSVAHIQTPTASWNDLSSGQGDFTVEMFIKQTAPNTASALITHVFAGNNGRFPFVIAFGKIGTATASNQMYFGHFNGTWIGANSTWEPVSGQWHHIAASREGAVYKLFADGVLIASFTNSAAVATNGSVLYIGRRWDNAGSGTYLFQGVIDELRITKGVARYTENFTPPDTPFPDN